MQKQNWSDRGLLPLTLLSGILKKLQKLAPELLKCFLKPLKDLQCRNIANTNKMIIGDGKRFS